MQQAILTIIFYIWLIVVLVLLFLMWRDSSRRVTRLQQALIDVSNKSAEAAQIAAATAQQVVARIAERKHDA